MVDFLKIELHLIGRPAIVRLRDKGDEITQAFFVEGGATVTRFGIRQKPKHFYLSTREMQALCAAWTEYESRVWAYTVEETHAMQHAFTPPEIREARKLLKEQLHPTDWANCSVYPGESPDTWAFVGPFRNGGIIKMENESPEQLLADITEWLERKESDKALDAMDARGEQGTYSESELSIDACHKLLEGAAHPGGWTLEHIGVNPQDDRWSFDNGQEGEQHFSLLNKPATKLLDLLHVYLVEKLVGYQQENR